MMTFTSVFGFLYALTKAMPVLDGWLKSFFAWYAVKEKEWFLADLHKVIASGDPQKIEEFIKSPRAGKPSGHDGVEYEDPDKP
jgi:hypothetical protein